MLFIEANAAPEIIQFNQHRETIFCDIAELKLNSRQWQKCSIRPIDVFVSSIIFRHASYRQFIRQKEKEHFPLCDIIFTSLIMFLSLSFVGYWLSIYFSSSELYLASLLYLEKERKTSVDWYETKKNENLSNMSY